VGASEYDPAFLSAVKRLLTDEGGYSDRTRDAGGATRFGISQREYPQLDIKNLTREDATEIYWRDWWCKFRYGALPSPLSAKMLDLAVNIGPSEAARCLQRALRACGVAIADNGILGPVTRAAASSADRAALIAALRSEAAGYYRLVAASKTESAAGKAFLSGWLNRAYE
jgi:lysozyme family protein